MRKRPPIGVIAPNKEMLVILNAYKEPEKTTTPTAMVMAEVFNA